MSKNRICCNCKFYSIMPSDLKQGECRRFPPAVFPIPNGKVTLFPAVVQSWSCGEFVSAIKELSDGQKESER